jgi:hypothetical protein
VVFAPADWAFKKAIKMIKREQLVPLENPENQQELITPGERREDGGEARPWIIPVSSKAETRVFTNPTRPWIPDAPAPPDLPPWCPPSEAEKILRKNIHDIVTVFLDKQAPGNKLAQSKMLYRRIRLVCDKPVAEMNVRELERVWLWVHREYGLGK